MTPGNCLFFHGRNSHVAHGNLPFLVPRRLGWIQHKASESEADSSSGKDMPLTGLPYRTVVNEVMYVDPLKSAWCQPQQSSLSLKQEPQQSTWTVARERAYNLAVPVLQDSESWLECPMSQLFVFTALQKLESWRILAGAIDACDQKSENQAGVSPRMT